jgi:hypothetical protein
MLNSHCSQIARALLNGEQITEAWLNKRHIRSQNGRMRRVAEAMGFKTDLNHPCYAPIKNIGATFGTDTKLKSGKVTRCGIYYLPAKYRPCLKRAIKAMQW